MSCGRGSDGAHDDISLSGKGKCKGKGKSVPKCPPPPPKAAPPRSPPPGRPGAGGDPLEDGGKGGGGSGLVSLYWRVVHEPPAVPPLSKDPLFTQTAALLAHFEEGGSGDTEVAAHRRKRLNLPPRESLFAGTGGDTIFAAPVEVQEMPSPMLEAFFTKHKASLRINAGQVGSEDQGGQVALIDSRRLQMIGILLQKYLMAHRGEGGEAQAVLSLKRAVLRCDYDTVKQEGLSVIRTVLRQHAADGGKVSEFVRTHGEAALQGLAHPNHHRLVHELLKVPQIDERLECMLFVTAFGESLKKCREDLEIFCRALQMLIQKRELLRKFFSTAHRLGQSLNHDSSRAPQAPRGFQLSALDKLVTTKSTASPAHNLLHFVLALISRKDATDLFTADDILLLSKAKTLKSYTVYQDCIELVQGLYGVREICETGKYTNRSTGAQVKIEQRRKTLALSEKQAQIDTDDHFHEKMKIFVNTHLGDARAIAQGCFGALQAYKDLAVFLDDLASVYPPPRDEKDTKLDLIAVLHQLGERVRCHREEVDRDGLREMLLEPRAPCVRAF